MRCAIDWSERDCEMNELALSKCALAGEKAVGMFVGIGSDGSMVAAGMNAALQNNKDALGDSIFNRD